MFLCSRSFLGIAFFDLSVTFSVDSIICKSYFLDTDDLHPVKVLSSFTQLYGFVSFKVFGVQKYSDKMFQLSFRFDSIVEIVYAGVDRGDFYSAEHSHHVSTHTKSQSQTLSSEW